MSDENCILYVALGLAYLLTGALLPLAISYMVYFVRKRKKSGKPVLFAFVTQLFLALFLLFVILGSFGLLISTVLPNVEELPLLSQSIFGFAVFIGFLLGIVFLVKGIKKGKKLRHQPPVQQS